MEHRYFYCYSARLKKALTANGFRPICMGINGKSHKKFWLFEGTDELNNYKDNVYPNEKDYF